MVFTGGPGSGKTSVIHELINLGFQCASEVGRKIIQLQVTQHGTALPWEDKVAFRDEMVKAEMLTFDYYQGSKSLVFFDRGIVDSYGYSRLEELVIPEQLVMDCKTLRYNPQVFIFPPWEEIFINDAERKQQFKQAIATYDKMVSAYQKFGYTLVEVPKTSVAERLKFILTMIEQN